MSAAGIDDADLYRSSPAVLKADKVQTQLRVHSLFYYFLSFYNRNMIVFLINFSLPQALSCLAEVTVYLKNDFQVKLQAASFLLLE